MIITMMINNNDIDKQNKTNHINHYCHHTFTGLGLGRAGTCSAAPRHTAFALGYEVPR